MRDRPDASRGGAAHIRLVTGDEDETPHLPDNEEPLDPEVLASLARLRERLKLKLFAPNPGTRPQWGSIHPSN